MIPTKQIKQYLCEDLGLEINSISVLSEDKDKPSYLLETPKGKVKLKLFDTTPSGVDTDFLVLKHLEKFWKYGGILSQITPNNYRRFGVEE